MLRNKNLKTSLLVLACAIAGFALCAAMAGCGPSTANNRAYLEQMENRSVDEVQQLMFSRADQKRIPLLKEYGSDGFLEPEVSCEVFDNCVFIGDSVTYMGYLAGYMTKSECSAYYSVSLKTCDEYVQNAIDMRPSRIIFNFGTNDMVLFGGNGEAFAQMYKERADWIKRELPLCQVYITSTLKPTDACLALNDGMVYASEFNEAVSKMCANEDRLTYVNTADLAITHADLHASDGIHWQDDFYGYWFARAGEEIFL